MSRRLRQIIEIAPKGVDAKCGLRLSSADGTTVTDVILSGIGQFPGRRRSRHARLVAADWRVVEQSGVADTSGPVPPPIDGAWFENGVYGAEWGPF